MLVLPATIAMFELTGFHEVEQSLMSGQDLIPPVLAAWLEGNIPTHVAFAALFAWRRSGS